MAEDKVIRRIGAASAAIASEKPAAGAADRAAAQ
jgi:hypothetical protein